MHERVVATAAELTLEVGWAGVTMGKLAERVGVSRQTVYNEVGSKPALAETMILEELARFLQVVEQAFDAEPDDLTRAIERAVTDVLTYASANKLLHAVVSATHGADTELLPLLTTNAGSLLEAAGAPPEALDPLMRRTIENGFELTGPIARGDWETVDAHLAAIRAERPQLEPMYVALADTTKALL